MTTYITERQKVYMKNIEIAFATIHLQKVISVQIGDNTSIAEAIIQSKIQDFFPEYNLSEMGVGVFGKRIYTPEEYQIKDNDRIEIYRPLNKSPNQKRLDRAKNNK